MRSIQLNQMNEDPKVWELGSEFHWLNFEPTCQSIPQHWAEGAYYGSGRDALRSLLLHGMRERGWQRLWIPSYFCQEVIESIASTGIEIPIYEDNMLEPSPLFPREALRAGDTIFVVNYFGLRLKDNHYSLPAGVELVEDHTHDPWSTWAQRSEANFCVASLRKTLPIPDGGILWSPKKHPLPPTPPAHATRQEAARGKLAAMLLKSLYLQGHAIDKAVFRQLALTGEEQIGSGEISGMTEVTRALLFMFPVTRWQNIRRKNHAFLSDMLNNIKWCEVLQTQSKTCCPFSAILHFDSPERCDNVRSALLAADIYPASYWALDREFLSGSIPEATIELSQRILSIHCDMRYQYTDMARVAEVIGRFV